LQLSKYLVHKAVEFSSLSAAVKKRIGATTISDLAATYDLQYKYDGCNTIIKLLNVQSFEIISRTGEKVRSMNHVGARLLNLFRKALEKGEQVVVLGEAWAKGYPQPRVSGWFRKHDPAPHLQLAAFDVLTLAEFEAGKSDLPFYARYEALSFFTRGFTESDTVFLCPLFTAGSYGDPMQMADQLCANGIKRAFDGAILRDPNAGWVAGSGSQGAIIKAKPRDTFDLKIIGFEEGEGKYAGTTGKVVLQFADMTEVRAAGGTDAERAAWWADPLEYIGKVGEVAALERLPSGELREPVFKGVRYDKECGQ
jgi:ATP-dependent DNA ligase